MHTRSVWSRRCCSRSPLLRRKRFLRPCVESLEQRLVLAAPASSVFGAPVADAGNDLSLVQVDPPPHSHQAEVSTDITATFNQEIDATSADIQSFAVHSRQRGQLVNASATVGVTGSIVTLDPAVDFFPGELVQASITSGIEESTGSAAEPHVWEFRTAVSSGVGWFSWGAGAGGGRTMDVALGDLDGDGDLDIFEANYHPLEAANRVRLNDGAGQFTDTGQMLANHNSLRVSLGDLDSDGDLDAFVNSGGHGIEVWLNDGKATFSLNGQQLYPRSSSFHSALGDLDGDGDLDAHIAGEVWLNDGAGFFSDSGQRGGESRVLGDLDDDGDLDAFGRNVWLNDGTGVFTDTGHGLGDETLHVVDALGDLDGDGDLDALASDQVLLNDGRGVFANTGQDLGNCSRGTLGDLDGDGDLDAFLRCGLEHVRAWLNDGAGHFTERWENDFFYIDFISAVSLGDLDGDHDLDALVATSRAGKRVFLNEPTVTLGVDDQAIPEDGGRATFTATLSHVATSEVIVDLGFAGTASSDTDYTVSGTQIVIPAGALSGSITVLVIDDNHDEGDEEITVAVTDVTGAGEEAIQVARTTILNDDKRVVTLRVDNTAILEASGTAVFTATLSEPTSKDVTVVLDLQGTATLRLDYMVSGGEISIPAGSTTGSITVTAVEDQIDEVNETVIVDIAWVVNAVESGQQRVTTIIADSDEHVPVLTDPGPQTMSTTQDTLELTLMATDGDPGDTLAYSATLESAEYYLDLSLELSVHGDLFLNFGELQEKWLLAGDGQTWYYITPDGNFYRWLGGGALNRELVATLSTATYADPSLLYRAEPGAGVPATSRVFGNVLTIDPDDGFVGAFSAVVTVSDGELTDSEMILISVEPNVAPTLANTENQSLPTTQSTLSVPLTATDPTGDPLVFSATVHTGEYYFDQAIGLNFSGDLHLNWSGSLNEKWLLGDDGNTWYFITPDGSLWRWLGGDRDIASHSELVAKFSPATYVDPARLHDAQASVTPDAMVVVTGDILTLDPGDGFVGIFSLLIAVTDNGGLIDSQLVRVDVTAQ